VSFVAPAMRDLRDIAGCLGQETQQLCWIGEPRAGSARGACACLEKPKCHFYKLFLSMFIRAAGGQNGYPSWFEGRVRVRPDFCVVFSISCVVLSRLR
jgi:hypothetical protein